jgi:hypothetical protein
MLQCAQRLLRHSIDASLMVHVGAWQAAWTQIAMAGEEAVPSRWGAAMLAGGQSEVCTAPKTCSVHV